MNKLNDLDPQGSKKHMKVYELCNHKWFAHSHVFFFFCRIQDILKFSALYICIVHIFPQMKCIKVSNDMRASK